MALGVGNGAFGIRLRLSFPFTFGGIYTRMGVCVCVCVL